MPERTVDGRMIVGRNFDTFEDVSKESATTYCTHPEGRYASAGNCDIWVGRWDGLNKAGLFTGTTWKEEISVLVGSRSTGRTRDQRGGRTSVSS